MLTRLTNDFFRHEDGSVTLEYILLAGAVIILLGVGVSALFGAMSDYFGAWANFFNAGS